MAEEIDVKLCAVEEFVVETLRGFKRKINEIEVNIKEDIEKLKRDVSAEIKESVKNSEERIVAKMSEFKQQVVADAETFEKSVEEMCSPNPKKQKQMEVEIPVTLEDISNEELCADLKPFSESVKYSKKDKLTPAQLYFVHYWISKRKNLTGRSDQIECLIAEGEKKHVWPKGFRPALSNTFPQYLEDKVKNILKRQKIEEKKKEYAILTDLQDIIQDDI